MHARERLYEAVAKQTADESAALAGAGREAFHAS